MWLGLTLRARAGPAEAVDVALAAEAAGFDRLYVGERHFDTGDGFANAFAVAAAISGRLRRASIGVAPAIGMEHPLRLVEQANMLSILTRGRSTIVLSDALEPRQYASFGMPVPRNGLFEDLLQHLEEAWSWDFQEDGPALEFHSGAYAAKMAGRIMPAACPRLALETDSDVGVRDAARRGWAIHLRADTLERARAMIATYRAALAAAGHSTHMFEDGLNGVTVVLDDPSLASVAEVEALGAAEVRVDLPLDHAIRLVG